MIYLLLLYILLIIIISYLYYDRFCQMLSSVSETSSHSHSDMILNSLQECSNKSDLAGRSFVMLCKLVDHKNTGKITIPKPYPIGDEPKEFTNASDALLLLASLMLIIFPPNLL